MRETVGFAIHLIADAVPVKAGDAIEGGVGFEKHLYALFASVLVREVFRLETEGLYMGWVIDPLRLLGYGVSISIGSAFSSPWPSRVGSDIDSNDVAQGAGRYHDSPLGYIAERARYLAMIAISPLVKDSEDSAE